MNAGNQAVNAGTVEVNGSKVNFSDLCQFRVERVRTIPSWEDLKEASKPSQVADYWRKVIAQSPEYDDSQEHFACIFLTGQRRIFGHALVCKGDETSVESRPTVALRCAIMAGAQEIVFAHNHPQDSPAPSDNDKAVYIRLKLCAKLLGVKVLDGMVIGEPSKEYPDGYCLISQQEGVKENIDMIINAMDNAGLAHLKKMPKKADNARRMPMGHDDGWGSSEAPVTINVRELLSPMQMAAVVTMLKAGKARDLAAYLKGQEINDPQGMVNKDFLSYALQDLFNRGALKNESTDQEWPQDTDEEPFQLMDPDKAIPLVLKAAMAEKGVCGRCGKLSPELWHGAETTEALTAHLWRCPYCGRKTVFSGRDLMTLLIRESLAKGLPHDMVGLKDMMLPEALDVSKVILIAPEKRMDWARAAIKKYKDRLKPGVTVESAAAELVERATEFEMVRAKAIKTKDEPQVKLHHNNGVIACAHCSNYFEDLTSGSVDQWESPARGTCAKCAARARRRKHWKHLSQVAMRTGIVVGLFAVAFGFHSSWKEGVAFGAMDMAIGPVTDWLWELV